MLGPPGGCRFPTLAHRTAARPALIGQYGRPLLQAYEGQGAGSTRLAECFKSEDREGRGGLRLDAPPGAVTFAWLVE